MSGLQTDEAGSALLVERRGPLVIATMNRPKALNALTLPMIRALDRVLIEAASDPAVAAFVLKGAGDRAFCAGGDVVALVQDGPETAALRRDFFWDEYRLNRRIHTFPKPFIPLVDGVAMGGGVGVSVHGSHRIATERVLFSMPETAIGLFPDVGGGYFLPRLAGGLGAYLALTNARLKLADVIWAGLYDHFVPSDRIDPLVEALAGADWTGDADATIESVLSDFQQDAGAAPLAAHAGLIDACFQKGGVAEILAALDASPETFAADAAAMIRSKSPLMSEVSLRQLQRGAILSFDDCMVMEYRMVQTCMAGHEFFEGVRALLIDKGRKPVWSPADLAGVTDAMVEAYFEPLGAGDLTFGD